MFSTAAFALALLASSAVAKIIPVDVGKDGLKFTPNAVFADVGDEVVFTFYQKNHSLTETSFDNVCHHTGPIDSGFMFVPDNQTDHFPTFTVNVEDTKPMWFYCAQATDTPNSHCGQGMVFAINCPSTGTNTLDNFMAAALKIGEELKAAASSAAPTSTSASDPYYGSNPTGTSTSTPPTTTDGSTNGTVYTVVVGGTDGLVFNPSHIDAKPGDYVTFEFKAANHTATQSAFNAPCEKLKDTNGQVIALDSGFMPVNATQTSGFPTWSVLVNDTKPLWFYCRQQKPNNGGSHCGSGMVFAVNANETSDKSFEAFQALAEKLNGTSANNNTSGNSGASDQGPNGTSAGAVLNTVFSLAAAFFAAALLL